MATFKDVFLSTGVLLKLYKNLGVNRIWNEIWNVI